MVLQISMPQESWDTVFRLVPSCPCLNSSCHNFMSQFLAKYIEETLSNAPKVMKKGRIQSLLSNTDPSTWEVEAGEAKVQGHSWLDRE